MGREGRSFATLLGKARSRFAELLLEPYYLCRDHNPNPLGELQTTNLDCAEFIGALEKSLCLEFLTAVGAPSEKPEISLAIVRTPKKTFRDTLSQWGHERNN